MTWLSKLLGNSKPKPRCKHCGSANVSVGYYSRSWNNLCNQAAGDRGLWCYRCERVSFDKTAEEYNETKMDWVSPATK